MPKKRPNIFLTALKFAKDYWLFLSLAGGFLFTMASLPQEVKATKQEVEQLKTQQQQVNKWIEAYEHTQELIKKAPEGYRWNPKTEEFEVDPDYVEPETPPHKKKHS